MIEPPSEGARPALSRAARSALGAPKRVTVGFWRGFRYPFRGARFVYREHPELVRFWLPPICITLLVLAGVWFGAWQWHGELTAWMWEPPAGDGFWSEVGQFFHGALRVLVFVLLAVLGFMLVVLLSSLIAAPFNDALSEEVERIVTGQASEPFRLAALLRDIVRTIGLEAAKLLLYVAVMGTVFVLTLAVPVVGQVLDAMFSFLFTAFYFAIDYVDWPAARRGKGVGHRFALVRRRATTMLGFGAGVWAFLLVPLLNLLFMPAAVAGGTLLYLELEGPRSGENGRR